MSAFIITLVFFICDAAAHLYIQKYHKADGVEGRGGAVTKVLLMPSLYMSLHLAGLAFGRTLANEELVLLVAIFYTLGDMLLIFRQSFCFYLGVVSFMVGHCIYIAYFAHFGFSWLALLVGLSVFGALYFIYCRKIISMGHKLTVGFLVYGLMILIFATGMAGVFSTAHILSSATALIGVVLFGWSDSRIAYNMAGVARTSDFLVMLSYILANVFLALAVFSINV